MLDIRLVRSEPDRIKAALSRRNPALAGDIDRLVALDAQLRGLQAERDETRSRVNAISKDVGVAKREGDDAKANELAAESRRLGDHAQAQQDNVDHLEANVRELLLTIPNLPAAECPDGKTDEDNPVLRTVGFDEAKYGEHNRVPHWDIGQELGLLDLERGAKLSGSMFAVYRGLGARLSRALCQYALDRLVDDFEEIRPPTLVRTETLVATGHLPKFEDELYAVERDDLWAIPTAEVPLTSLARDEVLTREQVPMRVMAHTSCFRREAGAAGRDTRGLLRVHEFDKVEMMVYAAPEEAADELPALVARAEQNIADLGLAYRVIEICTGDLGRSHHRSFDVEAYSPGTDKWLECSSVSWFSDYQARRANVRYKADDKATPVTAHTLNGSAIAVPRVWAALVETYRQPDGSIEIPEVLRPYMRGIDRIPAPSEV